MSEWTKETSSATVYRWFVALNGLHIEGARYQDDMWQANVRAGNGGVSVSASLGYGATLRDALRAATENAVTVAQWPAAAVAFQEALDALGGDDDA